MENQTISELLTDDKKSNVLATLMLLQNQLKTFMKNFTQKRQHLKLPLLNFLVESRTEIKSQVNNFTIARQTISRKS